jgi:hypothetical protein
VARRRSGGGRALRAGVGAVLDYVQIASPEV